MGAQITNNTILEIVEISKGFPGVQALNSVSFSIQRGSIHAIVGENGAGKSTLMKIIAGLYQPDSGKLILDGELIEIKNPQIALGLGIAMVPQELNLVPQMKIAENILLGIEPHHNGFIERQLMHKLANETLQSLDIKLDSHREVGNLTVAEQQLIQIARAIANKCNILILDEPTATLSEREKVALFERLRLLNERGTTILYISHRMEEIFEISDRITVLRDGKLIGTKERKETNQDEIVHCMIGRAISEFLQKHTVQRFSGDPILEVKGFSKKGYYKNVNFKIHKGEILGFAGLVGSGRTEVMNGLFGYKKPDEGKIFLNGKTVHITNPINAVELGIGYVPEERKRQGIFPVLSVLKNISIPYLKKIQKFSFVDRKIEAQQGESLREQLHIATPSLGKNIIDLSGGNQQKVILARWIGSGASILILDEPTRGIDVNAKAEIHALIDQLTKDGKTIIIVSSETQELLGISDRIIIMREGEIAGEVYADEVTEQDILRMAMLKTNNHPPQSRLQTELS